MSDLASVAIERRGDVTLARLVGELDMTNAEPMRRRLLEAGGEGALVLDLTGIEYLDSAWFSAMDRLARAFSARRGGLRLVCPPDAPSRRVLEVAGIDRIMPLHATAEAALAAG